MNKKSKRIIFSVIRLDYSDTILKITGRRGAPAGPYNTGWLYEWSIIFNTVDCSLYKNTYTPEIIQFRDDFWGNWADR